MTMQYEQQNINLEVETAFKSFIFDPNGTQSDTVFTDWNTMLGVLQELPGIKEIIIPEGPPVITIPAGTYDMTNIILRGESVLAFVEANDAVFENLMKISSMTMSVGVSAPNTVSNLVYNTATPAGITLDEATLLVGPLAAFPMIDVSTGATLAILAALSALTSTNPAVPVLAIDATSSVTASTGVSGTDGNSWGGGMGSDPFVVVALGGTFILSLATGDVFWAANNPSGPTSVVRFDDYESAVVADWSGVEPLNVKNALDRIAAAVGPIA